MLTDHAKPVDGGALSAPPDGLWMTISDIARSKGVSKQAISKRVDRFVAAGALATRKGARGAVLVNLAAYDRAAGEVGDAIREMAQAATTSQPDASLAREQARRISYQADLAEMDREERRLNLLRADDVVASMTRCAEKLVSAIDRIPSRAGDITAAVAREGEQGARSFLKTLAHEIRVLLARELRMLESGTAVQAVDNEEDAE